MSWRGALGGIALIVGMGVVSDLAFNMAACTPSNPPADASVTEAAAPEAGPSSIYVVVYNELVEAGCLGPDMNGPQSIQDEAPFGDPWLTCLIAGGQVATCSVPGCSDDGGTLE